MSTQQKKKLHYSLSWGLLEMNSKVDMDMVQSTKDKRVDRNEHVERNMRGFGRGAKKTHGYPQFRGNS